MPYGWKIWPLAFVSRLACNSKFVFKCALKHEWIGFIIADTRSYIQLPTNNLPWLPIFNPTSRPHVPIPIAIDFTHLLLASQLVTLPRSSCSRSSRHTWRTCQNRPCGPPNRQSSTACNCPLTAQSERTCCTGLSARSTWSSARCMLPARMSLLARKGRVKSQLEQLAN